MVRSWRRPPLVLVKYYVYMATTSIGFSLPVWVVLLLARGVSYTEIAALNAVFSAVIILGETPTGYVADRLGRRKSLIASALLISVGVTGFAFAHSFLTFAVVYVVWALGQTFRSGSSDAWLYDVLKDRLAEDQFARVRGRANALTLVVTGVTSILAGYLAAVDLRYPFFATAAVTISGVVVLVTFPRSQQSSDDSFETGDVWPVVRDQLLQPSLRWFVVYVALFYAVIEGVSLLIQPISTDVGVAIANLGWLYAGFTFVAALVSYNTDKIREYVGIRGWMYAAPPLLGLAFVGVWFVPLAAIPAFFVMKAFRGATPALANQYLNDNVDSTGRATLLSAASMAYAVVAMPIELGTGVLAQRFSPVVAVAALGAGLALCAGIVVAWQRPVVTTSKEATPSD